MTVNSFTVNDNEFEKAEKKKPVQHQRTSKTGKVFPAGKGAQKEPVFKPVQFELDVVDDPKKLADKVLKKFGPKYVKISGIVTGDNQNTIKFKAKNEETANKIINQLYGPEDSSRESNKFYIYGDEGEDFEVRKKPAQHERHLSSGKIVTAGRGNKLDLGKVGEKTKTETIDITPTWNGLYPIFCEWIDRGSSKQKQLLKDELKKLVKIADEHNRIFGKKKK